MQALNLGDVVVLEATFRVNGTLSDPTTVACTITTPSGPIPAINATKVSLGVYRVNYTPTATGMYTYAFAGTGPVQGAARSFFRVED